MSHGEGGWEKFSQPFVEQFDNKCNQKMKRLEINEGFKQLARGNLNLLLETEIKAGSEQNGHKLKRALGKKCRQLFVSLTKVN